MDKRERWAFQVEAGFELRAKNFETFRSFRRWFIHGYVDTYPNRPDLRWYSVGVTVLGFFLGTGVCWRKSP